MAKNPIVTSNKILHNLSKKFSPVMATLSRSEKYNPLANSPKFPGVTNPNDNPNNNESNASLVEQFGYFIRSRYLHLRVARYKFGSNNDDAMVKFIQFAEVNASIIDS
jgi:hypothetical protein